MAFSMSLKSLTVEPSSTFPARPIAPVAASMASANVVLPLPEGPKMVQVEDLVQLFCREEELDEDGQPLPSPEQI